MPLAMPQTAYAELYHGQQGTDRDGYYWIEKGCVQHNEDDDTVSLMMMYALMRSMHRRYLT